MNPGKIIDTPHLLENFRPNASPGVFEPKTTLDFSHDGGFGAMVDMCNGQGACRKTQGGTMCPSYMVTREEEALDAGQGQRASGGIGRNAARLSVHEQAPPRCP